MEIQLLLYFKNKINERNESLLFVPESKPNGQQPSGVCQNRSL